MAVIHRDRKLGFGTACVTGFKWALDRGADFILQMESDGTHMPEYIPRLLDSVKEYDVVVGSRYVSGGRVDPRWGLRRKLLSRMGNVYARFILGLKQHDLTNGFRCFSREALQKLDLIQFQSRGEMLQVEMAYACQKAGLRVAEIPIVFLSRTYGQSKMSTKIIWEVLWQVWQIRRSNSGKEH